MPSGLSNEFVIGCQYPLTTCNKFVGGLPIAGETFAGGSPHKHSKTQRLSAAPLKITHFEAKKQLIVVKTLRGSSMLRI